MSPGPAHISHPPVVTRRALGKTVSRATVTADGGSVGKRRDRRVDKKREVRDVNDPGLVQRLRNLVGRDCEYLGRHCRLVEILADEGTLVLETREAMPPIQEDQYGQAAFRATEMVQIPILSSDGEQYSDEMMHLLECIKACAGAR